MKVTNEQAKAEVICGTTGKCNGCPAFKKYCEYINGTDPDVYSDLLEARKLIKEMRELTIAHRDALPLSYLEVIIDCTKDYAK